MDKTQTQWKMILASTVLALSTPLLGALPACSLEMLNGYRADKLTTSVSSYSLQNALLVKDHIHFHDVTFYQLGFKGLTEVCGWYARGEAYWGWSENGRYNQLSEVIRYGSLRSNAEVKKGRTRDFIVGGGYLYSFSGIAAIGPVAGWSYDYQQIVIKNVKVGGYRLPALDGVQYSNHWQGPWIGVDAKFKFCGIGMRAGYEYHFCDWQAKWLIRNRKACGIVRSDRRKSNNAYGNVLYLDAIWDFCPFMDVGVSVKLQRWEAKRGKKKQVRKDTFIIDKERVKNTTWESASVSLDTGIDF